MLNCHLQVNCACSHCVLYSCLGIAYVNSFATHIFDANMNKSTSMMLLLINTTSYLIQVETYSIYYQTTTNYLMALFGVYFHKMVHIDLKPRAKAVHYCTYHVPHIHQQTFKKELNHMAKLGILEPCGASEWASSAFIIP